MDDFFYYLWHKFSKVWLDGWKYAHCAKGIDLLEMGNKESKSSWE